MAGGRNWLSQFDTEPAGQRKGQVEAQEAAMAKIVSVFGGARPAPGEPAYQLAQTLGEALARAGWTVATGGYSGTMEAVSRGASEAGGHVIGVTCGAIEDWKGLRANQWVREETRFATLRERLNYLVEFCDAAVALPGGIGTLSEVALTWSLLQTGELKAKPLVVVGRVWRETLMAFTKYADGYLHPGDEQLFRMAEEVDEVVALLNGTVGTVSSVPGA
jgi:uncharacterized protein (TIGR00730 family)